jgi:lipopolysaccharide export system permease protein
MTLLRVYVVLSVIRGVALALAVLVTVTTAFDLVAQLDDVGTGTYTLGSAIVYVLLGTPRTIFSVLPAAALIGSLLALGNLAVHRELVVMRASGISSWQLLLSVGLAGFVLAVLMVLLGESLAPSLGAYAVEMRTRALREDLSAEGQATWLKDGDHVFSLRRQTGELGYRGGVLLFELGPQQVLRQIARADTTAVDADGRWVLSNFGETRFLDNGVMARTARQSTQTYNMNPDLLALSVVREDLLDTPSLQRYIRYLKDNGLDARRYLIAYWTRLSDIASVVLMTILALPFVLGGLRSAGTGARLLFGLVVGLSYYAVEQVLASGGEVYGLHPLFVAWAPSSVLLLITIVAMARAR